MQIVKINLVPSGVNPVVYASQHDNGRVVRFNLYNGPYEWSLNVYENIHARITRPDGSVLSIPMTNDQTAYSDLVFNFDDLNDEGIYLGELVITDIYDNVTGSLNFILKAEADPYGDDVTTETASGNPCTFETDISDTLVSLKSAIVASGGYDADTQTSHPIVGHSELNLVRCGKNLFDAQAFAENQDQTFYNWDNGVKVLQNDWRSWASVVSQYSIRLDAGTYTVYADGCNSVEVGSANGQLIRVYSGNSGQITINAPTNVSYKVNVATYPTTVTDLYIAKESTFTGYAPYNGTPYLVSFGQTVYGGEYDANTGKATITEGYLLIDENTPTLSYNGATSNTVRAFIDVTGKAFGSNNILSDRFQLLEGDVVGRIIGRPNSNGVEFYLPATVPHDTAGVKAWFGANNTQLVYELATPIEIDVSSISVDAVVGTNNIVSDGGGDVEVTYIKKV